MRLLTWGKRKVGQTKLWLTEYAVSVNFQCVRTSRVLLRREKTWMSLKNVEIIKKETSLVFHGTVKERVPLWMGSRGRLLHIRRLHRNKESIPILWAPQCTWMVVRWFPGKIIWLYDYFNAFQGICVPLCGFHSTLIYENGKTCGWRLCMF